MTSAMRALAADPDRRRQALAGLLGSIQPEGAVGRARRSAARRAAPLRRAWRLDGPTLAPKPSRPAGSPRAGRAFRPAVTALWRRLWFSPAPARGLGVARAVFFGGLFLLSLHRDFREWGAVSSAFWRPMALFQRFRIPVLSFRALGVVQVVWRVSLALSALGLFTRASVALSFFSGAYLLGLPNNFGQIQHEDALVVLATLVLAFSRSGDAFSLDRVLRRKGRLPPSGEYRWPVLLICALLALVFLGAGVSKLRGSGFGWFTTDNLAYLFLQHQYPVSTAPPLAGWGVWLAKHRLLCRAFALSILVLECGYPLALFSRAARRVLVPSAILMLVSFRVLMGPDFSALIVCHAFWIPWKWLDSSELDSHRLEIRRAAARVSPASR